MHKMMGYLDGTLTNDVAGQGKLDNLAAGIFEASGLPAEAVTDLRAGWNSATLMGTFRPAPALNANPLLMP